MELLTAEEAAEMFKVKVPTIRQWLLRGKFPKETIFKLGKRAGTMRFIKPRLEDWINGKL